MIWTRLLLFMVNSTAAAAGVIAVAVAANAVGDNGGAIIQIGRRG